MLPSLSLLLAVATAVQATTAPAPTARAHRRAHAAAIAPLTAASAELEAAAMTLQMAQPDFVMLSAQAPVLATAAELSGLSGLAGLSGLEGLSGLAGLTALADVGDFTFEFDGGDAPEPRWPQDQASAQGDVADSAYRAARQALNRNDYQKAAELFRGIRDRYPKSTYVPNTYYWEAFALYRAGSDDNLRAARTALQAQADQYPKATTRRDAAVLLRRVQGALARSGDAEAAEDVVGGADSAAPATPVVPAVPPTGSEPTIARGPRPGRHSLRDDSCDDDDDIRIAALNAVLQMDPDRAVPLLKTVLARRDDGSACLRRKAVFLLSQKRTSETSGLLLNAVRSDPDQEVREQAVFWLSQVPGDETVAALDSILRDSRTPPDIQDKAIFALSQHNSSRSASILRTYAERRDAPAEMREKAIFWLGQRRSPENAQFLKDLYAKMDNDDLKEKIIFSLSQMGGADNYRWLMDIALNPKEDIEIRKKALFRAGQGHNVDVADLVRLYDSMNDREMKEQLIFVYSQRREDAALDKLFQIGKNDPDRELRKKAIFWVGQSRSPRAAQYLQDLINQ
jgi:TolA-binding protein